MLAFRRIWIVKNGMMEKARALLVDEIKRSKALMQSQGLPILYKARIYTPHFSPEALVLELDFDSIADRDTHWENYASDTEARTAFYKQWNALTDHRESIEVWDLITVE